MKLKFAKKYQAALQGYLQQRTPANLRRASGMGQQALAAGLQTLDIAKLHEQILVNQVLAGRTADQRVQLIKQAGAFFAEAITPIEKTHPSARDAAAHLSQIVESLSQRTVELAASNLELTLEITHRKAVEVALKKSEHHYSKLLERSENLQEQLRQLSRQILSAQEEERREISRELHDVIAQTLTGINVRLAALAKEATVNTKNLDRSIAKTQKLVEKSVDIVHQFARELRPAVLDDLGLIPALHTFIKTFSQRTRLPVNLLAYAGVETLDIAKRTVLFRVAQEALNNVSRHAKANRVEMNLQKTPTGISMTIHDNGKSFQVDRTLQANGGKRLGLLGMRERVEMVGGTFCVESAPGQGTSIQVDMPTAKTPKTAVKISGRKTPLECP
jgi:signal transduction histidine kinase